MNGEITEVVHHQKCRDILEAAEVLAGYGDFNEAPFRNAGLTGITSETRRLGDMEYLAIADDLGLQLHAERGVANRMRSRNDRNRPSNQPSAAPTQTNAAPARPRTLDDLPGNRERLNRSGNPAARRFGQLLQEIQDQLMSGQIDAETHLARAHEILAAATALSGTPEDFDDDALQTVGLRGMTLQDNRLSNVEFLAISDDLGVQRHSERGVIAYRNRVRQSRMDAQRQFNQNLPHIPNQNTAPAVVANGGGPRASSSAMNNARDYIRIGNSIEDVIETFQLTHPLDVQDIETYYAQYGQGTRWLDARSVANRMQTQTNSNRTSSQPSAPRSGTSAATTRPRTLDDLPRNRELLHRSANPAAQRFGQLVQQLHADFMGGLAPDTHLARAHEILAAAAALAGETADFDQEALQAVGLEGMTLEANRLTSAEYLAISDDLGVQRHPERGVLARRQRVMGAQRQISQGLPPPSNLNAAPAVAANLGGSRVSHYVRNLVHVAIDNREPLNEVILRFNLTHPEDIADAAARAVQMAIDGGPRASSNTMNSARDYIRIGQSATEVISAFNLTNRLDVQDIEASYALHVESLMAQARSFIYQGASVAHVAALFGLQNRVAELDAYYSQFASNGASRV